MKHSAHTIDGTLIYQADSYQSISDAVCKHISDGLKPDIAYTYKKGDAFPYTTWHKGDMCFVGNPCRDFDEVINNVRKGV